MKPRRNLIGSKFLSSGILSLLTAAVIIIAGSVQPGGSRETNQANVAESAEIREYEGKELSSMGDFRENSIKGPQYIDRQDYILKITGLVDHPESYTYDQIVDDHKHHKKVVALNCVGGWSVTILWEGVLVKDLIEETKPSASAKTVIFRAHDGYSTSFPIAYITDKDIIMAHEMNDVTLSPERGFPFELVAEGKWGYKWIKWITEIELSDDANYRGYWEKRGYSNNGDLDKPFWE